MPRLAERLARASTQNYGAVAMLRTGHLIGHARAQAGLRATRPPRPALRRRDAAPKCTCSKAVFLTNTQCATRACDSVRVFSGSIHTLTGSSVYCLRVIPRSIPNAYPRPTGKGWRVQTRYLVFVYSWYALVHIYAAIGIPHLCVGVQSTHEYASTLCCTHATPTWRPPGPWPLLAEPHYC